MALGSGSSKEISIDVSSSNMKMVVGGYNRKTGTVQIDKFGIIPLESDTIADGVISDQFGVVMRKDYTGGDIGKPVGVDIRERKITLPLLGALSRVDAKRQEEVREMVRGMSDRPGNAGALIGFVMENDGIAYAQDRLKAYSLQAVKALSVLPDSPAVDYLVELANFTADRDR